MSSPHRRTRAEQRASTRARLLEAAAEVFAQRGYHGARVEEIATAAGLTQGALYANFEGKEGLFLALVDERLLAQAQTVDNALEQHTPGTPGDVHASLREHTRQQFDRGVERGATELLLYQEVLLHAIRERPELRQQLAERSRRADLATAEAIRAQLPQVPGTDPEESAAGPAALTPDELALAHSALVQGLGLRMLLDAEAVPPAVAAKLLERIMSAVAGLPSG